MPASVLEMSGCAHIIARPHREVDLPLNSSFWNRFEGLKSDAPLNRRALQPTRPQLNPYEKFPMKAKV